APADPWDGRGLEWATTSPPPPYNFGNLPNARGRDAFWITRYGGAGSRGVAMYAPGQIPRPVPEVAPTEPIHMPAPSFFPLVIAAGLFVIGLGWVVFWFCLGGLGGLPV